MHGGCNKVKNTLWIHSTNIACIKFEAKNPTNGDRIREMSNEELARIFMRCWMCEYNESCWKEPSNQEKCYNGRLAWLNAPACVTQNGNHDTQPGLCVADNTESEGEDE
jgi:hypothetical protein